MKLLKFVFVIAMAYMGLACKENERRQLKDTFSFNDENSVIQTASFVYDLEPGLDDEGNEYYRNQLMFTSDGVIVVPDGDGGADVQGSGTILALLINNDGQTLEPGLYTWQSEENEQPFDFWSGDLYVNWNKVGEKPYAFTEGTVRVSKSKEIYRIIANGIAYPRKWDDNIGDWVDPDLSADPVDMHVEYEGLLTLYAVDF